MAGRKDADAELCCILVAANHPYVHCIVYVMCVSVLVLLVGFSTERCMPDCSSATCKSGAIAQRQTLPQLRELPDTMQQRRFLADATLPYVVSHQLAEQLREAREHSLMQLDRTKILWCMSTTKSKSCTAETPALDTKKPEHFSSLHNARLAQIKEIQEQQWKSS